MAKLKFLDDYIKKNFERTPAERIQYQIDLANAKIGAIVAYYRHKHHLTQVDLGKLAQVPQSSIARIENGGSSNTAILVKILSAMNEKIPWKSPREIIKE